MPIFASIDVSAAKTAESSANINHIQFYSFAAVPDEIQHIYAHYFPHSFKSEQRSRRHHYSESLRQIQLFFRISVAYTFMFNSLILSILRFGHTCYQNPQIIIINPFKLRQWQGVHSCATFYCIAGAVKILNEPVLISRIP